MVIDRLNRQRARDQELINKDPFSPKVYAGSGLAWTYGYPSSIDGSAPPSCRRANQHGSIQQAAKLSGGAGEGACAGRWNRPQPAPGGSRLPRGVAVRRCRKRRARARRAKQEEANLARAMQLTRTQVDEGQALAIEFQQGQLRGKGGGASGGNVQSRLVHRGAVAGRGAGSRAGRSGAPRPGAASSAGTSGFQDEAIAFALDNSPEVKRLESDLQAKTLELKSYPGLPAAPSQPGRAVLAAGAVQ